MTATAKTTTKTTSPKHNFLGIATTAQEGVKAIKTPTLETLDDCQREFESLHSGGGLFEKASGEVAWLKGYVLNALRPIKPKKNETGIIKKGDWEKTVKELGISKATADLLRHINKRFSRSKARDMGYTEMVNKHREERAKNKPEGSQSGSGLTVANAEAKADKIVKAIEQLCDGIAELPDLDKDADRSNKTLNALRIQADAITNHGQGMLTKIDAAAAKVEEFKAEGQAIANRKEAA